MNFNLDGKVLMIKDDQGEWDLPGGRINHGENLPQALERECDEELGVKPRIIDSKIIVWSGQNTDGAWRVDICYQIEFADTNFKLSSENVEHGYFNGEEARKLKISSHLNGLKEIFP